MNIKKYFLSLMMTTTFAFAVMAAPGKEGTLTAKTESGKVQFTAKTWDVDEEVSKAQLTTPEGTIDLSSYESFSVIDLPNHIMTICFRMKAKPTDATDTKSIKVWAIPSSFVKVPGSDNSWRFKVKIFGTMITDVTLMDATFDWK